MIMTKHFNIKILIESLFLILLITGCGYQGRYNEFVTTGMYYPEVQESPKIAIFGTESFFVRDSGYFEQTQYRMRNEHYHLDHKLESQPDKGVIAYWQVKTPTIDKYYYAQNLPGKETDIPIFSKWGEPYLTHLFMSFGPMSISGDALTKEQLKTARHIDTWGGNNKIYQWGEPQNLYYRILVKGINVEKTPIDWQIVEGIEISQQQFDELRSHCRGDRPSSINSEESSTAYCYLDGRVIELTEEQTAYMAQHPYRRKDFSEYRP